MAVDPYQLDQSGYVLEEKAGTRGWSTRVRRRAKDLSLQLETAYMELGRILYQVYDVPVDGDPKNQPVYRQWGYNSFSDYAEAELGLNKRKAEFLRTIFYRLEVELKAMDPAVKQGIIDLGWCKVRELIRILSVRNAAEWLEIGKKSSFTELRASISKYREEIKALPDPEPGQVLDPKLPGFEKLYPEVFQLYEEQKQNVTLALQRSMELSGSKKKSHNLDLICMDFLATNEFTKAGEEQKKKYLAKLEQLLQVKIVAIDPKEGTILHGLDSLEKLVEGVSHDHDNERSTGSGSQELRGDPQQVE